MTINEQTTARVTRFRVGGKTRYAIEVYKPEARGQAFAVIVMEECELLNLLKGERFNLTFNMWEKPR